MALAIMGSVAAAPVSSQKKPLSQSKKPQPPKVSRWEQHIRAMLKVSAPGDEYFGRMKMSYLGIDNTFHDDLIRAGAYTIDPKIIGPIEFADDALTAWAHKYPNDPQLARSYFLAFQMYRKIWVQRYQDKAWQYAHTVIRKWPGSFFGKSLKRDLAIGFTEHYFATPVMCEPIEVMTPAPHGKATPTPTPSPTPTPTPAPGRPKTEILPVPCLTPTPSPSPVPTGSLLPSPLPRASGSPTSSPSVSPSPSASPTRRP